LRKQELNAQGEQTKEKQRINAATHRFLLPGIEFPEH